MVDAVGIQFADGAGSRGPEGACLIIADIDGVCDRVERGSLLQGVRRLVWLLPNQEHPKPASETIVPNCGLAMTLIQGAGVSLLGPR